MAEVRYIGFSETKELFGEAYAIADQIIALLEKEVMRNILGVFLAFTMFSSVVSANPYNYRVVKVIDGDTVEIDAPYLPVELKQVLKLRISGVDTPEKGSRAKCEQERSQAEAATRFTQRVVGFATRHQVTIEGWDKYGGRIVGDLLLDGKSLRDLLIASGYARPYDGGKKDSWC